jgi:hypothetical protein
MVIAYNKAKGNTIKHRRVIMKITNEHLEHMRQAIKPLKDKIPQHIVYLRSDEREKDIHKRLRWDLFHAAKLDKFACDELYKYMNDDHIDTALKSIVGKLRIIDTE